MKKILAMMLAAAMITSFAACGSNDQTTDETTADETKIEETTADEITSEETTADEGQASDLTLGQTIYEDFKALMNSGTEYTAESLAAELIANEAIQFMCGTFPVAEGYLSGFDDHEVKGFKEAAGFGPMIGSIAFIGYIFELEEGADMDAFVKELTDNCNLRWNICVTADETICNYVGNTVFFLMAPNAIEG